MTPRCAVFILLSVVVLEWSTIRRHRTTGRYPGSGVLLFVNVIRVVAVLRHVYSTCTMAIPAYCSRSRDTPLDGNIRIILIECWCWNSLHILDHIGIYDVCPLVLNIWLHRCVYSHTTSDPGITTLLCTGTPLPKHMRGTSTNNADWVVLDPAFVSAAVENFLLHDFLETANQSALNTVLCRVVLFPLYHLTGLPV